MNQANNKKLVLITGAGGFIGYHLVERFLNKGYRVHAIARPSAKLYTNLESVMKNPNLILDYRDILSIPADDELFHNIRTIYHMAAFVDHMASKKSPEMSVNNNMMTLLRVLEAARLNGSRFVYPSSAAIYGKASWPTPEDCAASPINPYGLSKWMGELLVLGWHSLYDISYIVFRIFNGYGPGCPESSGVFGTFLKKILLGEPITITGDGSAKRDFIYIDDIVDALILGGESDKTEGVYNLGTGILRSVKELSLLLGGEVEYIPARREEPPVYCADIKMIQRDFGWSPLVSLEEGVKRTMRHYIN